MVKMIQSVYLPVTDTAAAAEWYVKHLGLELLRPVQEDQAQLGIGTEQMIFLIRSQQPVTANYIEISGTEQCALTLEVDDLPARHAAMKQNGAYVTEIEDNAECGLNFYAFDPAGNKIDIWGGWPRSL